MDNSTDIPSTVKSNFQRFFSDLDGHEPAHLYELFLTLTEKPFLETVMSHCRFNQSKACRILGLNRGTLRTRLQKYGIEKP